MMFTRNQNKSSCVGSAAADDFSVANLSHRKMGDQLKSRHRPAMSLHSGPKVLKLRGALFTVAVLSLLVGQAQGAQDEKMRDETSTDSFQRHVTTTRTHPMPTGGELTVGREVDCIFGDEDNGWYAEGSTDGPMTWYNGRITGKDNDGKWIVDFSHSKDMFGSHKIEALQKKYNKLKVHYTTGIRELIKSIAEKNTVLEKITNDPRFDPKWSKCTKCNWNGTMPEDGVCPKTGCENPTAGVDLNDILAGEREELNQCIINALFYCLACDGTGNEDKHCNACKEPQHSKTSHKGNLEVEEAIYSLQRQKDHILQAIRNAQTGRAGPGQARATLQDQLPAIDEQIRALQAKLAPSPPMPEGIKVDEACSKCGKTDWMSNGHKVELYKTKSGPLPVHPCRECGGRGIDKVNCMLFRTDIKNDKLLSKWKYQYAEAKQELLRLKHLKSKNIETHEDMGKLTWNENQMRPALAYWRRDQMSLDLQNWIDNTAAYYTKVITEEGTSSNKIKTKDNKWISNPPYAEVLKLIESMRVYSEWGKPMRMVQERFDCGIHDKQVGANTHFHNDNSTHDKHPRMTVVIPIISRKTAPFLVSRKPIRRQAADRMKFEYGIKQCCECKKKTLSAGFPCIDHPNAGVEAVRPESVLKKFGYCFPMSGLDTDGNDVGEVSVLAFGGPQWHARQTNLVTEEDETVNVCGECQRDYIFPEIDYEDEKFGAGIFCHNCKKDTLCINLKRQCVGVSASFFFRLVPDFQVQETIYAPCSATTANCDPTVLYEAEIIEVSEDKEYATLKFVDVRLNGLYVDPNNHLQKECETRLFLRSKNYRRQTVDRRRRGQQSSKRLNMLGSLRQGRKLRKKTGLAGMKKKQQAEMKRNYLADLEEKQRRHSSLSRVASGRRRLANRLATAEASF